jgi:hypothetical protein
MTGVDALTAYFTNMMLEHETKTAVKNTAFYQIMEEQIKESGAANIPEVTDDDYEQTINCLQSCITQGAQRAGVDVLFGLASAKAVMISEIPGEARPKLIKDIEGLLGNSTLRDHVDAQVAEIEKAVRKDKKTKPESKEEGALRVIGHVDQAMLGITALLEIVKRAVETVDYGHIAEVTLNAGRKRVKEELTSA